MSLHEERSGLLLWMHLLPWLLVLPMVGTSQSLCPEKCACDVTRHLVDCQNGDLHHIPWNLPDSQNLTDLDLRGNLIVEVTTAIQYHHLHYLDISDNNIFNITPRLLRNLRQLQVLNLHGNRLSMLLEGMFAGLVGLRQLDVSHNDLTILQMSVFRGLNSLEDLNLAGNEITDITPVSLTGLASLHYLTLADNHLTVIHPHLFSEVPSLKTLSLAHNQLTSLPQGAFSALTMLRELDLQSNLLADIHEEAFSTAKYEGHLEKLDLRNNHLAQVPSAALVMTISLETLDLSQNPMTVLLQGAFEGLNRLQTITLTAMPYLTKVEMFAFSGLGNLQDVQINSNHKLSEINKSAFLDTPQLKYLDLHANSLRTLDESLLDWRVLERLDLRYNPWHCDCHLSWVLQALGSTSASNISHYLAEEVRCSSPEELNGRLVVSLEHRLTQPNCSTDTMVITPQTQPEKFQDHIMIAIMCSVSGILVIVIVILMCKYGSSYRTAYASTMDPCNMYLGSRKTTRGRQRVPVIESDPARTRGLRSSLSSSEGHVARSDRKLYRVRFAEADQP